MEKELQREKIVTGVLLALAAGVIIAGAGSMGADFGKVMIWWGTILALGIIVMPLTYQMFHGFHDLGWAFSKGIGIAISAWFMWVFASIKVLKFSRVSCIIICIIILGLNVLLYFLTLKKKGKKINISLSNVNSMLVVEILFLGMFIFWCYLRAFKPEAYGTEKFMDFGFMKIMERSDYMPPQDLWLSGVDLNYYYVGQFVGTFLSKLSGINVDYGYNLMLMTIAALAFTMVYSLVRTCFAELTFEKIKNSRPISVVAGIVSGSSVVFAGNVHYLIYGVLRPKLQEFTGAEVTSYWFPDATRYIGYNTDVPDKTIHEFPSYSFILGDLHAHVINIIFVLTVLGILYSWLMYRKDLIKNNKGYSLVKEVFAPQILVLGFFIGFFHTTNFWDYPIYYVVSGAVILFSNIVLCKSLKGTAVMTAIQGVLIYAIGTIVCLPFTLSFNQISTEIKFVTSRTPLYQLAVLWALPIILVVIYIGNMIYCKAKSGAYKTPKAGDKIVAFFATMKTSEMFMMILGLCAIGLTFMPEVIYVKDIYEGDYSRANTMFKLTYQAYIMYGVGIGYALLRLFINGKGFMKRLTTVWFLVWIGTVAYFGNASHAWFGEYQNKDNYKGLDATAFMETENYADYEATNWLNENIEGTPVVLEANGDSYTFYERVSTITGLPTVLGWRTHEWLWQSDGSGEFPAIASEREEAVRNIYTSQDINQVKELIEEYDVEYIYIGKCEYEKFPEMNVDLLKSLGEVAFEITTNLTYQVDGADQTMEKTTYIIQVSR